MKRTVRALAAAVLSLACVIGVAAPAHAQSGDPIGSFDATSVRLSYVFYYGLSTWQISGWAADPDAPGQAIDVHVYLDGERYGVIHTGGNRPDVPAVFPFAGDNSGWTAIVNASAGAPHTVCVYAINVGDGTENTTLGCTDIPQSGPNPGDPRGHLDEVGVTSGLVRFRGWAGDPDGDAVDPSEVRPFIDGQPYASLRATGPRPDVHAVFPELGNAGGFDDEIAVLPGLHIYCLDVGNSGSTGADNPSLGCDLIEVPPGDARGSWDATTIEPVHPDGRFGSTTYEGWAWDPGAHPATVRMRDVWTGFTSAFLRTQSVSDYQTGEPRPDVQQAFPGAPPDTGWKISFPDEGIYTARTPTDVYRCFYVVTSAEEQLISCAPLTTRTVDAG